MFGNRTPILIPSNRFSQIAYDFRLLGFYDVTASPSPFGNSMTRMEQGRLHVGRSRSTRQIVWKAWCMEIATTVFDQSDYY
jgi:hypothetical protein